MSHYTSVYCSKRPQLNTRLNNFTICATKQQNGIVCNKNKQKNEALVKILDLSHGQLTNIIYNIQFTQKNSSLNIFGVKTTKGCRIYDPKNIILHCLNDHSDS